MKRILNICAVLLTCIILLQSFAVSAASATGKISLSGPAAVQSGDTVKISVNVTGKKLYGVNGAVTFSSNLTLTDTKVNLSGEWKTETNTVENTVYFAAADQNQKTPITKQTKVLTLTFTASGNIGDTISVKVNDAMASDRDSHISLSKVSYSKKLTEVSDSEEETVYSEEEDDSQETVTEEGPSDNNLLASLVVKNAEITPEFDPEVKKYETTVPFTTKELEVEAVAQDENATVTIGDTVLEYVGNNIVRVEVVSESGLKRTYKIYAARQDKVKTADGEGGGLSLLWIILICVGAALLLAAITVLIIILVKKRKKKNS